MNLYDFREIAERGSCIRFLQEVAGVTLKGDRCAAFWRNGSRDDSVAVKEKEWYDHAEKVGGGLLELCALVKFGSTGSTDLQRSQEFLGEWLHLTPRVLKKPVLRPSSRYEELIKEGYTEKCRYEYKDLDGKVVFFVIRMEHPAKHKEFLQGTPDHWGLEGVKPVPYNWKACSEAETVYVVEGEKDVETLRTLGLAGTTNNGGAGKWNPEFCKYFPGKKIVVLPDNDEVGQEHGRIVAEAFLSSAASVKVLTLSGLPKGDVTDWIQQEGGTLPILLKKVEDTPAYVREVLSSKDAAKRANREPFRNYCIEETTTSTGRTKTERMPRQINDLIADLHTRLLGAPYRVGSILFDQDRETGKICYIYDSSDLFSWIARKTRQTVDWTKADGCVTKTEFFSALRDEAKEYSAISHVPDFPKRDDVFYTSGELPAPSMGHHVFWNFVDFFSPADQEYRSLLAAFIMAPIYHVNGVDKPLWIIDSIDGQGSGKSTIPAVTAKLYGNNGVGGEMIDISLYDLEKNYSEVVKRIISTEGRNARILRIDNVIGRLRSENLARMVTAPSISGRAAYGRGEESRPNNLSYVITVNSATVDTDIATRAFYIMVKRPALSVTWREGVYRYIEEHRTRIFADIIDMISRHVPFSEPVQTRTPEFEARVLQPACQTEEQYRKVLGLLQQRKEETNTDEETARRIEEEIGILLREAKVPYGSMMINPDKDTVFIRSHALEAHFRNRSWLSRNIVAEIRALANIGLLTRVDRKVYRYPHHDNENGFRRASGILWNMQPGNLIRTVDLKNEKEVMEIAGDSL